MKEVVYARYIVTCVMIVRFYVKIGDVLGERESEICFRTCFVYKISIRSPTIDGD